MKRKTGRLEKPVLKKAVFLGRDGLITLPSDKDYNWKIENVILNPHTIEGLKRLQKAGFLLIIVTNQGGIAKGLYTKEDVNKVHKHIWQELKKEGIKIEKIYYCPHHESVKTCVCRKPSPFMINLAIDEFNIDRKKSYLIGNGIRNMRTAQAAGIKSIKLPLNHDITSAVDEILKDEKNKMGVKEAASWEIIW